MKTQKFGMASLVFITAVLFAIGSVSFAAQTAMHETGTKDVKEKMTDAARAIEKYSVDQRDQAVEKAKSALDNLDAFIDSTELELNKKWDQIDQSARTKARAALTALSKQRNEVAEWYGGLKHGSSNAWEDIKKGFLKSYQGFRDTFDKVRGEF